MTQHTLYTKEQIKSANQVNLMEVSAIYLITAGTAHIMPSKMAAFTSLKDSNRYLHFSSNTHSETIDFAIHFCRIIFKEAVAHLLELPQKAVASFVKEPGQLILPDKAPNYRLVTWYLTHVRNITCMKRNCINKTKRATAGLLDMINMELHGIALCTTLLPISHSN